MSENTPIPGHTPDEEAEVLRVRRLLGHEYDEVSQAVPLPIAKQSQSTRHDIYAVSTRRLSEDKLERLKSLKVRPLRIDPEHPYESPDLIAVGNLYAANLVPDEALEKLIEGNAYKYTKAVERGAMLNKFDPDPDEREHYPEGYESVKEQIVSDLLGLSGRPGSYHMIGLFDESEGEEKLRAYISLRVPPRPKDFADERSYGAAVEAYVKYLEQTLLNSNMTYESIWDKERMRRQLHSMWEIDTVNVEKGWGGGGALAVDRAIEFVREYMGELPEAVYCYRFVGLRMREETGQEIYVGRNRASHDMFETFGFFHMATKTDKSEVVIRKLSDGECHSLGAVWGYLHNGSNKLQRHRDSYMEDLGLKEGPGSGPDDGTPNIIGE